MKQERRPGPAGHGRRLLEIGKEILIVFLVLVNVTLAIMCLPTKTLTQTKWLASALRPFAGLFGLNEAELTYTAPATGSAFIGAAQPIAVTLSTEAGRQSAQYDFAALDTLYGQYGGLLAQALESAETPQARPRRSLLLSGSHLTRGARRVAERARTGGCGRAVVPAGAEW